MSGTLRGTIGAGTKIVATIFRYATPRDLARAGPEGALAQSPGGGFRGIEDLGGVGRDTADSSSPATDGAPRNDGPFAPSQRKWLLTAAGVVLTGCVAAWALGPPPTTRIGPQPRASSAWPSRPTWWRSPPRGGCPARARPVPGSGSRLAGRAGDDAAPPQRRRQSLRLGRADPAPRGKPLRWGDRRESPRWQSLHDALYDGVGPQGLNGGLPAPLPAGLAASSRSTTR